MKFKAAAFVSSSANYKQCPQDRRPEIALIGRSNVGKSSLINMLLGNKRLAKVSGRPGKTQLINHFLVNETWYLVDLPGYGWAQVSQITRQQWKRMIYDYLLYRENLNYIFVLVDARLKPQKIDIAFINWLGRKQIPFAILLTKADKASKQQVQANLTALKATLLHDWEALPELLVTSSRDQTGKAALWGYIQHIV